MIRVGSNSPHVFLSSHIGIPKKVYANHPSYIELPDSKIMKTSKVHVGNTLVYPEGEDRRFRYTLKYRMILNFNFSGNSTGFSRNRYAETITSGTITDTVRLDTISPVFVRMSPLITPEESYLPFTASGEYSNPPWGKIEKYSNFSGTELLVTPRRAINGSRSRVSSQPYDPIYQQYTQKAIPMVSDKDNYRVIIDRVVNAHVHHPVMRSDWDYDEETYDIAYRVQARKTTSGGGGYSLMHYINEAMVTSEIDVKDPNIFHRIRIGFAYRKYPEEGLNLITDMKNQVSDTEWILTGNAKYGYIEPGHFINEREHHVQAPMFSGTKHIDCYDTDWNVGRTDLTGWDDPNVDIWSHTDLYGTFSVIENNNPTYGSIGEYLDDVI